MGRTSIQHRRKVCGTKKQFVLPTIAFLSIRSIADPLWKLRLRIYAKFAILLRNIHTHPMNTFVSFRRQLRMKLLASASIVAIVAAPHAAIAASSWSPTLLVNTESFQTVDEGDGTTDVELRFGGTLNEKLIFDRTQQRFEFTDDLSVQGYLSGSLLRVDGNADINGTLSATGAIRTDSNLTINDDQTAANATITFGNDGGNETLQFSDTVNEFELSDDLRVTGNLSSSGTLSVETAISTDGDATINADRTSADAVLTFGNATTNQTIKFLNTNQKFQFSTSVSVQGNISGSTLRVDGNADVHGALTASGAFRTDNNITINDDAGAADASLTFGNDAGNETITFSDTFNEFSVSDDLRVTGNLSGSGNLNLEGNLTGATINGFGLSNCTGTNALRWNSATGKFECAADQTGAGSSSSGGILSLHPEYPNAIYFSSGSTFVGQMVGSGGTAGLENVYHWSSTRSSIQDYWVAVRVRLPNNFSSWDPVAPIQLRYRTGVASASNNHVTVRIKDTSGAAVALSGAGGLSNVAFTTATITGPEASGTWAPKGYITLYVKVAANNTANAYAEAGYINLNFETTN